MSYTKTNWTSGDTITADKLNNIEDGVKKSDTIFLSVEDNAPVVDGVRVNYVYANTESGITQFRLLIYDYEDMENIKNTIFVENEDGFIYYIAPSIWNTVSLSALTTIADQGYYVKEDTIGCEVYYKDHHVLLCKSNVNIGFNPVGR